MVESPDLPIPAETLESAAEAILGVGRRWVSDVVWDMAVKDAAKAIRAALPHLRSLQVETQLEFGRALGRREATEEAERAVLAIRDAPKTLGEVMADSIHGELTKAARAVRNIGKGDPNG